MCLVSCLDPQLPRGNSLEIQPNRSICMFIQVCCHKMITPKALNSLDVLCKLRPDMKLFLFLRLDVRKLFLSEKVKVLAQAAQGDSRLTIPGGAG